MAKDREKLPLLSHAGEGDVCVGGWGWGGNSYATDMMSLQVKAPAEVTSLGSSPVQTKSRGHTDDVMKQRSEEEGERKTHKSDYILLNMHPRFITHTL